MIYKIYISSLTKVENGYTLYADCCGFFCDDCDILVNRYQHLDDRTCHNDLDLVNLTMADPRTVSRPK